MQNNIKQFALLNSSIDSRLLNISFTGNYKLWCLL